MISSSRSKVYASYRRLFRARKMLFEGDHEAMAGSRIAIKEEYLKNAAAPTSGQQFDGLLKEVDEAIDMLLHGVVRGNLNPNTGHYGMFILHFFVQKIVEIGRWKNTKLTLPHKFCVGCFLFLFCICVCSSLFAVFSSY